MLASEYRKDFFLEESMLTRSINLMADQLEKVYDPNSYKDIELDENLIGYLLDFSVIDHSTAENLRNSPNQKDRFKVLSDSLLNHRDFDYNNNATSKQSSFLLVNALRQYGYHSLANKLDIGRRIIPSSTPDIFVNELYNQSLSTNPEERLRGQIRIWIQVSAIKIGEKTLEAIQDALIENGDLPKEVVVIDAKKQTHQKDLLHQDASLSPENIPFMRQISKTPNGLAYWIDLDFPRHHSRVIDCVKDCIVDEKNSNSPIHLEACDVKENHDSANKKEKLTIGCFLFFKKLFKKRKKREITFKEKPVMKFSEHQKSNLANFNLPKEVIDILNDDKEHSINTEVQNNLKCDPLKEAKTRYLDEKSDLFYEKSNEIGSKYNDSIIKYFEQTLGVLFLGSCKIDSSSNNFSETSPQFDQANCLLVSIIATSADKIKSLIKYSTSNLKDDKFIANKGSGQFFLECQLARDLENVVKNAGILKFLDIEDIRLAIGWDRQETKTAFLELKNSRH